MALTGPPRPKIQVSLEDTSRDKDIAGIEKEMGLFEQRRLRGAYAEAFLVKYGRFLAFPGYCIALYGG
eukprot:1282203-Amorphochlora_amoeboformis.AAC.2